MKLRDSLIYSFIKQRVFYIPRNKEHSCELQVPARVESLFILEDLACLQLLLINCLLLLRELAPVFLALKTHITE